MSSSRCRLDYGLPDAPRCLASAPHLILGVRMNPNWVTAVDAEVVFAEVAEVLATTKAFPSIESQLWPCDVDDLFDTAPLIAQPSAQDLRESIPSHDLTNPVHRCAVANLIHQVMMGGRLAQMADRHDRIADFIPL